MSPDDRDRGYDPAEIDWSAGEALHLPGARVKVCVVGLGKLGAPLAAVLARAGHTVTGVDVNPTAVDMINAGEPPVDEPALHEAIAAAGNRLRATSDLARAVRDSEMTFVIVPTPSRPDGTFDNTHVIAAVADVGAALRELHDAPHVVVITSTVMPGSTEGPIRQALETHAGRRVGRNLGLCYSPEFIALGSVIRDMTNPDLLLVGSDHRSVGERLARVLLSIADNEPPVVHLSWIDAEIAKLAVNTFVTTKISYANMLAEICDALPGSDAQQVARAVGLDSRVGSKYLAPGAPYGGPCFPRDNIALAALARQVGASADLAEATDTINRRQAHRIAAIACAHATRGGPITVLGLTYKPGTHVVEESAGISVARHLVNDGMQVIVHDPAGLDGARTALGDSVAYEHDLTTAVAAADVVVVTTPWSDYRGVAAIPGTRTVVDCWNCCDPSPTTRVVRPGNAPPALLSEVPR